MISPYKTNHRIMVGQSAMASKTRKHKFRHQAFKATPSWIASDHSMFRLELERRRMIGWSKRGIRLSLQHRPTSDQWKNFGWFSNRRKFVLEAWLIRRSSRNLRPSSKSISAWDVHITKTWSARSGCSNEERCVIAMPVHVSYSVVQAKRWILGKIIKQGLAEFFIRPERVQHRPTLLLLLYSKATYCTSSWNVMHKSGHKHSQRERPLPMSWASSRVTNKEKLIMDNTMHHVIRSLKLNCIREMTRSIPQQKCPT